MHLPSPDWIESVAWEGELVPPETMRSTLRARPRATIGQPEFWPAAEALAHEALPGPLAPPWTPPVGEADFWLLRLACTLREPEGALHLDEAQLALYLRPRAAAMPAESTYAYSLYPERETAEREREWTATLTPELTFKTGPDAEIALKPGELGATFKQRRAFPTITAYDVGTPAPYWVFKRHRARPLPGIQVLWAVIAARRGSDGVRAGVFLTATMRRDRDVFRLGVPEEARARLSFVMA